MHDHAPKGRPSSLHARIRADIEARIRSGEWPAGHRIPTEAELKEKWGCARMTVHKAVSALAAEGLVQRNRKGGTTVALPRVHAAILRIPDIRSQTEARGLRYDYRLLADERRPPCCVHLGSEGHDLGRSRFLRSLHLADGRALLLEERQIFLDCIPEAESADLTTTPPGTWLLAHAPWTDAEHRISAIAADGLVAQALDLEPGAPCLLLERRTWRGDGTITIARQTFRGDAFDLMERFGPGNR